MPVSKSGHIVRLKKINYNEDVGQGHGVKGLRQHEGLLSKISLNVTGRNNILV